ncbi:MAG: hypothetical protein HY904_22875 [Deltaproteobacteria bacterium]|nr:hypothetical protein [Deltaproteobacteria bacterium]
MGPAHARLRAFMTLSLGLYVAGGLLFLLGQPWLFDVFHLATRPLGLMDTPAPTERFWLALAVSMMVMLCVCCELVRRDPVGHLDFCIPVIMSKFTSTVLGLAFFVLAARHSAYLVIGLTDLPLGVITLVLWRAARAQKA